MKTVAIFGLVASMVGLATACGSSNSTTGGAGGGTSSGTGTTGASCGATQKVCSGLCVNALTDNANCGACGNVCAQGDVCSAGKCATTCAATETVCAMDGGAGYCANVQTDNANCGACGTTCAAGSTCAAGKCSAGAATSCSSNEVLCSPDGGAADGGASYCAETQVDIANCGGCGVVCSTTNATPICQAGACKEVCADGYADCDKSAANGCETATATDAKNCGTCGTTCGTNVPCTKGVCAYPECSSAQSYNADGFKASQTIQGGAGEENLGATPTWYRFTGTSTDMLTAVPTGNNLCGAGEMGYISGGALPTNGATAALKVCFTADVANNTCTSNTTIQVTNCGTYNVYQIANPSLVTTTAASAYCMQ